MDQINKAPDLVKKDTLENKEKLKKRILVADDNKAVLKIITGVLGDLGYDVVAVNDGKELLDKITSGEKFDAVLSDNNMPEMNGIEVLERIRKIQGLEKLPFILQTASNISKIEEKVKNLGGRCFDKVFSLDDLENILKEEIEKVAQ